METMSESDARDQLCILGRSLFERGLATGSTGNISVRLDDGWLVTPANSILGRLEPERLSKLTPGGELVSGEPPSTEKGLHQVFYRYRRDVGAVVHLHSTHAVAVSCLREPERQVPDLTAYFAMRVGPVAYLEYFHPLGEELIDEVSRHVEDHDAMLLANHGPLVAGPSLAAALDAIEEVEETSRLHLLLRGQPTVPLTEPQLEELRSLPSPDPAVALES